MTNRTTSDVQALLDEAVRDGLPGITCSIAGRDGVIWTGTAGVADLQTGEPMRSDMLLGIGSITKTFIAVVILQLIEERRLRTQDTARSILHTEVDAIANAEHVTIAQLLNHTSGIPSWEDDSTWIRQGRGAQLDVSRIWGGLDTLEYIRGSAALFVPGTTYSYSNTNYTLLGRIIEKVTSQDIVSQIRERILSRLGLNDVYLEGFELVPQNRLPRRYHWATPNFREIAGVAPAFPEVRPNLIDVSASNLSVEWTAGGMVTTAQNLALYGAALRDGQLLNKQSMQFIRAWTPIGAGAQIGHGLFRVQHPEGIVTIGHNGDVLGFSATCYWIEAVDAVVTTLANIGTMHAGVEVLQCYTPERKRRLRDTVVRRCA